MPKMIFLNYEGSFRICILRACGEFSQTEPGWGCSLERRYFWPPRNTSLCDRKVAVWKSKLSSALLLNLFLAEKKAQRDEVSDTN